MTQPNKPQYHPALAALVGWAVPGAGHMMLGQRRRGTRVMIGMFGLIVLGVLIGGIDAVDSQRDHLWFVAQLGAGPIVVCLDVLNQQLVRALPEADQYRFIGLGHINAIGTLYIALAGLMNIVAVLDLFRERSEEQPSRRAHDARVTTPPEASSEAKAAS